VPAKSRGVVRVGDDVVGFADLPLETVVCVLFALTGEAFGRPAAAFITGPFGAGALTVVTLGAPPLGA
jgi:hypothetical protein